ncbi:MAG TPA: CoA transferase [Thermoanaerobaculia bacterium]|nr:CoA transferase [Thermoanaerobaculia bacterium]
MAGPLHGYTVLELATMVSGPLATQLLGDQGADVIKIEDPNGGDLMRHLGPKRGGMTAIFTTVNRNKRSLALDLKTPEGFRVLEHLVEGADVFVQNFRPGVAARMGLGYEAMRALRRDLIYVSISGFGEHGPYAQKRVYDPIIQALSGLAAIQADRDTGRPRMMRTIIPDKITAMTAAQAVTAALLERERSGQGQHIQLAMLDATVSFAWPEGMVTHTFIGDGVAEPKPGSTADLVYETADGYITASTMSDVEWKGMARATGHLEWLDDPRYSTPGGRVANSDSRLRLVGEVLRERTSAEWLAALEAEDVPCAPILSREQLIADPQVAENELLIEEEHPLAGRIRYARPAARFERTPVELRRPAPALGQHNREILGEIGFSDQEVAQLRAAGAFGSPPPPAVVEQRVSSATGDRGNGHG